MTHPTEIKHDIMKNLYILIIILSLTSCGSNISDNSGIKYSNDPAISTKDGSIIDSTMFFLPSELMILDLWGSKQIDTFKLKWFSANYLCFKEPILYNYYLGYENYRFLWIRSFNKPVLITIKKTNKISINTKMLARHPAIMSEIFLHESAPHNKRGEVESFEYDLEKLKKEFPNADSIIAPKFDTKIVLDTTYTLGKSQWNKFKELLDSCNFWKLEQTKTIATLDGAEWILEGQSQNKYQFVVRWSPIDSFEKCCEYLIKLSAAKKEDIY
jgi:hypothetical protein